jgi:hypothetical protein
MTLKSVWRGLKTSLLIAGMLSMFSLATGCSDCHSCKKEKPCDTCTTTK